ncbi:SPOR domain-containing protein [Cohnella panacarvi]|uniref:SPOR domain-containing protein n=1 Tax=Cohnella panacarvi TaxID=400776 RepID=UPI00047A93ED|nr:SPOR domain-containing protein [Cohnella panacarvi]
MPSNARMTFRFEQPPMQKPVKLAPAANLARTEREDVFDEPSIAAKPELASEARVESAYNHLVIEPSIANDGPYQDDIRALEDIIRRTDSVVVHIPPAEKAPETTPKSDRKLPVGTIRHPVVVRELEQTEPDHEQPERWSLPADDDYTPTEDWLSQAGSYRRNDSPTWTRVFLSVTAAIATGALFGYMVLTLFTGEPMFPGKQSAGIQAAGQAGVPDAASSSTAAAAHADDAAVGAGTTPDPNATGKIEGKSFAEVPANEAYVLQYGVFRNADSTQLAAAQLKDVGLPAAIDDGDGYRVYAGIASTRAEAELLAAQMPNIEVYIKPLGATALMLDGSEQSETIRAFMTESASLARLIAQLTVGGLQDGLPQPFAQEDADALRQTGSAWKAAKLPQGALTGAANAAAVKLEQALDEALDSLANYSGKTSRFHLWNAQTAIMQAGLADRELRDALQPAARG